YLVIWRKLEFDFIYRCSRDQLTPPSRTESTVFSLSHSESLWTTKASRSKCEVFWFPIHLMSTGGSFLACGIIISGLYFAGHCRKVTNILGPALLSIGLMVFVVGVVLIPITKENRKHEQHFSKTVKTNCTLPAALHTRW
uniref:Phosphoinositide interacting regulator of transient receptor potential channels n=1 Tax=Lates calcarifer TaxID=8187 RepID=A0A4W6CNL7_LATCA